MSRPVDGILLDDSGDMETQPLRNSRDSNGQEDEDDDPTDTSFSLFIVCCCCCVCILPFAFNVMIAIGSSGYTSCPTVAPLLSGTSDIPAIHSVVTPHWNWNIWFRSSDVYDPLVDNTTRVGYWRTAKTWYLRDVWAYVPQGSDKPGVVAYQPIFTWTTTYDVEKCFPPSRHILSRDMLWYWPWGNSQQSWSIRSGADQQIATAKKSKEWQWTPFSTPNGWQTTIWSTLSPNTMIGQLSQTYSSFWASDSAWTVDVQKPELLEPHVASFIAAANDLVQKDKDKENQDSRRRYRRMEEVAEGEEEEQEKTGEELEEKVV